MSPDEQTLAPVDYAVIAFPGSRFNGQILPALTDLVDSGTVRIIDLTVVEKDDDGTVRGVEVLDLAPDVRAGIEGHGITLEGLFNDEDIAAAGEELTPGSTAALIVWENLWAAKIAEAARASGGELFDFGRLPHDVVQAARDYAANAAEEA